MPMPRTPSSMKILKGTFNVSRNPVAEPQPTPELYAKRPPSYLGKHAKKHWVEMAQECIDMGTLSAADWGMFPAMCEAWGEYRDSYEAVYSYTDETGRKRKRSLAAYLTGRNSQTMPEYAAMHKGLVEWRTLAAQFGIGAANRNKIDLKERKGELSVTDKLLKEANG